MEFETRIKIRETIEIEEDDEGDEYLDREEDITVQKSEDNNENRVNELELEEEEGPLPDSDESASTTSSYYPGVSEIFFTTVEQNILFISFILIGLVYALISFSIFIVNVIIGMFFLLPAYAIYYFCGADPGDYCWEGFRYIQGFFCFVWLMLLISDFCLVFGCVCGITCSSCSFESRDRVVRWTQTVLPSWYFREVKNSKS